ncbi:homocysteine S-methyltransferase family protein [Clostridium rectalis]|uniref:homocysteine S-methyltransferase family protein n=1 Tax=Clostridium rectalis TaxID=2040295 RepID=UPI000F639ACE|nr:homocysteine S-methyltransferase family protein [Clostridium rectalis]
MDIDNFLILDGAMGSNLQKYSSYSGQIPEILNITNPTVVENLHRSYLKAGSDIITTNTFGANELKLSKYDYSVEEIINSAVKIAKKVSNQNLIALDIGPIGKLIEPLGELSFNDAYNIYKRQIICGYNSGVDIILIETMCDLYEAKAAILAAKENSKLPIFCTLTLDKNKRTLTGADILTMVNVLQGLGVDALGINCSLTPSDMIPLVDELINYSEIPIIVQPNAGIPKLNKNHQSYDITCENFSSIMKTFAQKGISILGGCCGTTPSHIKALKNALLDIPFKKIKNNHISAVSSGSKTVILDNNMTVIGERINPTGKDYLKKALINKDIDTIVDEAIEQKESGADILDINVAIPEIDEKSSMLKCIKEIQSSINIPLQIDSSNINIFEDTLRIYNGKPIINSINGQLKVMERIFPLAKKYGACIICLTLDENGIPSTAIDRFKIAEKMVACALSYGIPKEDLLIDCLVLPTSVYQEKTLECLKSLKMVKEKLKVKTVLGISNVSFGLPLRKSLNRTFLAAALIYGVDAVIVDTSSKDIMETIDCFKVLSNLDEGCMNFIDKYRKFI